MAVVGGLLVAAGCALLVVGVLGWRRRLPRNRFAGVRTAATLRDEEAFAVGNQVAGPLVAAAGVAALLGGAVTLAARTPATGWVTAGVGGCGVLALVLVGGLLGDRAAAAVPAPTPVSCGGVCSGCSMQGCRPAAGD